MSGQKTPMKTPMRIQRKTGGNKAARDLAEVNSIKANNDNNNNSGLVKAHSL